MASALQLISSIFEQAPFRIAAAQAGIGVTAQLFEYLGRAQTMPLFVVAHQIFSSIKRWLKSLESSECLGHRKRGVAEKNFIME